jgi:membrane protein DedA with SNARE-associated domain
MDQFSALLEFIKTYGAPVVLLWAIIETDLVFLVVGALSHSGYLNPYTCFPAAIAGALIHDTIVFWLARNRADWVRARKAYQNLAQTLEKIAQKTGPWQMALCRPLYGTRYPTIIYWGLQKLSYTRFYAAISAGLFPWASILTVTGYKLFHYLDDFDDWLAEAKNFIFGGVVILILLYVVKRKLSKKTDTQPVLENVPERSVDSKTLPGNVP